MNKKTLAGLTLAGLLIGTSALSGATSHSAGLAAPQVDTASLTEGEVRKVDKEAKKLTIRHGAIANLDMQSMTMVFQVPDAATLDSVKAGDQIRFRAEKAGGGYTATQIEAAK